MPVTQPDGAIETVATGSYTDAIFSGDGTRLFTVSGNKVSVIDVATGQTLAQYTMGTKLGGIDLSVDGQYLAVVETNFTGTTVGTVYRIQLSNGAVTSYATPLTSASFFDAAFLANGTLLVSTHIIGSGSTPLRVLDFATGQFTAVTQSLGTDATLTTSADGTRVLVEPIGYTQPSYVYTAGVGITAQYFGVPDPYAGAGLPQPWAGVQATSPAGDRHVVGVGLKIFDGSLNLITSLASRYGYLSDPDGLAFSPDGSKLYVAIGTHLVVFDTSTWDALGVYPVGATVADSRDSISGGVVGYGDIVQASADGRHLSVITTTGIQLIDLTLAQYSATNGADLISGEGYQLGLGGDDEFTPVGDFASLHGGEGNDTYNISTYYQTAWELAGQGYDTVRSTIPYSLGANIEKLILDGTGAIGGYGNILDNLIIGNGAANEIAGYDGNDELIGGGGDDRLLGQNGADVLRGNEGNDRLDGGTGADTMYGGTGSDVFVVDDAADVIADAEAADVVEASISYTLGAGLYSLTLIGSDPINGTGNSLANTIRGNVAANVLSGLAGNDLLYGGWGNDTLDGGTDDDELRGEGGDDILIGGAGNDLLNGGEGADSLQGGTGDDIYEVDGSDSIIEDVGEGTDRVIAATSHTLASNVENLTLSGAAAVLDGTGNDLANQIEGSAGSNVIRGLGGNDALLGNGGDDWLEGGAGNDSLFGGEGSDILLGGSGVDHYSGGNGADTVSFLGEAAAIVYLHGGVANAGAAAGETFSGVENLIGSAFNDVLVGDDNDNVLDGGAGADSLDGQAGDDTYIVDNAGDVISDSDGLDSVRASVSCTIGGDIEILTLTGSNAINGTGNWNGNLITGNGAANILSGLGGGDFLYGGNGNDTLDGGDGEDELRGEWGNDTLLGGAGNDLLIGGQGADLLQGGTGDDIYEIDTVDTVVENAGEGSNDRVVTEFGYVLGANVEHLTLIGVGSNHGTGNALDNQIVGNSGSNLLRGEGGNDILSGNAGADQIEGGDGDDSLSGGNDDDLLIGGAGTDQFFGGSGTDTVSYFNAASGAIVHLSGGTPNDGSAAGETFDQVENLIGSAFDDTLVGDGNANLFLGGAGNDTIDGGGGIDTVDYSQETGNAGVSVNLGPDGQIGVGSGPSVGGSQASDTFGNIDTLASIERIITGAGVDSVLGSSANEYFQTGAGDDYLSGGGGTDTLSGGLGNDTFLDSAAGLNGDTITDFSAGDRIVFSDATLAGFAFSLSGNTLTYSGGSLTLAGAIDGRIVARAAAGGGVQLSLAPEIQAAVAPAGDFNRDGRDDLIWRRDDGAFTEWLGQLNGGFLSNDTNAWTSLPLSWQVVGSGDFNGDNLSDLIWRRDDGAFTEWLGKPTGGFASNDSNAFVNLPTSWHVAGTGDFNGDNRDDILWRRDDGAFTEWLGQANGGFASNDANAWTVLPTSWHVVGTGDFNGDNRSDVLWRRDDGAFTEWLGQANGGFVSNDAHAWTVLPTAWQVAGTGDFNGDNRDDIIWRRDDGAFTEWLGQATGGFVSNDANAWTMLPNSWQVAAVGDFDGDNRDDIAWRHDNGAFTTWRGQLNGGFVSNDASAFQMLPNSWQVHLGGDQLV